MIDITNIDTLCIGKQGENAAKRIDFDLSPFAQYGNGTVQLLHQRSGDNVPYIVDVEQNGRTATWTVSDDDTAFSGYGRAQLNYYVGEVLAKSVVFTTYCEKSLTDETSAPADVKSDLGLIAESVENCLKPTDIEAGENITVTVDGKTVTISTQGGGVSDYDDLDNKPSINNVELVGNKTLAQLGVQPSGDYATNPALTAEATARQAADNDLQLQIDAITVSSDVIDVVGTYDELIAYDTSHVKANDIIKVLQDSTHSNALSYYRWVITANVGAWVYVGSEGPFYTKTEANAKFNDKLTAGTGITIENNVISASVGTMDYTQLENLPREPYTPEAQVVDFLDLANGKVYDAMGDFTLARYSGQTVVTSIDVHAGDMFIVGEYNSTDGYSMITLFCNNGVFSFQSNLTDWSKGYLPNAYNIDASLVVKPLPVEGNTESGTLTYECDVTNLADGVYIAEQTTVLTGWVSGTLSISKTTEVKKVNDVVFVGLDAYANYDLSTNVALYASMQELDRQIATRQPRSLYFKNKAVAATDWVTNDVADTSGYAYKAEIHCIGVTMDMRPRIDFTIAQNESGNYCAYADTSADTVTIYSNDNSAITIPLITAEPTSEGAGLSLSTVQTYVGNFLDPDIVVTDGAIDKYNRALVS